MRGCKKTVYYVKDTGSRYFDEAYLVMRADLSEQSTGDLAAEAERIVREAFPPSVKLDLGQCNTPLIGRAMSFALGAASSSALIGIVALLVCFS